MTDQQKLCLFTKESAERGIDHRTDSATYRSEACGNYLVTNMTILSLPEELRSKYQTQGLVNCARRSLEVVRENQRSIAMWTSRDDADRLRNELSVRSRAPQENERVVCALEDYLNEPVDHSEKPDVLLETFAKRLQKDRAFAKFYVTLADRVWARIVDKEELWQILEHLRSESQITIDLPKANGLSEIVNAVHEIPIQLTVFGWEAIRKRNSFPATNKVFIATQFDWPGEQALHQDAMDAIRSACKRLGYDADVVAQNHTGNITDRIIADIKRSRFVVAELTYNNRGVYFESGLARGLGLPVFHLVREGFTSGDDAQGKKVHFDIAQVMYRTWKDPKDLETKLTDWIEATTGRHE